MSKVRGKTAERGYGSKHQAEEATQAQRPRRRRLLR